MKNLTVLLFFVGSNITVPGNAVASDGGAATYRTVCASCHEVAAVGAPGLEDRAEWQHRLAQGMDKLYASVREGRCTVYVKELRKDLSDDAIRMAIDYMVSEIR